MKSSKPADRSNAVLPLKSHDRSFSRQSAELMFTKQSLRAQRWCERSHASFAEVRNLTV
jgi:hypothetical protein